MTSIDGRLKRLEEEVAHLTDICLFRPGGKAEFYTTEGKKVVISNKEFQDIRQQISDFIFNEGQPVEHEKLDDIMSAAGGVGIYLKAMIGDRHQKK